MRLEYHNGKIRADRYHHQRKEQIIPASQFCNQKNTSQRSMHYSRHQSRHSQQGKIFLRDIRTYMQFITEMSEDKPGDTPQEQIKRRCKDTTTTTATIRCTGSKDFEKYNHGQINE